MTSLEARVSKLELQGQEISEALQLLATTVQNLQHQFDQFLKNQETLMAQMNTIVENQQKLIALSVAL